MSIFSRCRPIALFAAGCVLATSVSVLAQSATVSPVAPYWAVVVEQDALLRSGAGDLMYPIVKLPQTQMLRVDGESQDNKGNTWARVGYPHNSFVFVPADAVQTEPSGKSGGLVKSIQPKAPNMTTGLRGSWSPAGGVALQAGAKVSILGAEQSPEGKVIAYRIAAPETARAFVPAAALRRATSEEIAALSGTTGSLAGGTPIPTAPASGQGMASQPRPTGADLTEPMQIGSGPSGTGTAAVPSAPAPAAPETTASAPAAGPVEIAQTPVAAAPREASPYERLESALEALRQQPVEQAEVSELMSEYQAEIARLDESPSSRSLKLRLTQRLEYLKVLADLQKSIRAVAESEQHLSEEDKKLADRLSEVDRTRQYTIVGRLSASTIYDGKRLPLMYRVQTVGGPAPRTLAYLKPDPKLAIDSKLGMLIGVIGEARMDPTLKLNIITPLRIDALEAASKPSQQTQVDDGGN